MVTWLVIGNLKLDIGNLAIGIFILILIYIFWCKKSIVNQLDNMSGTAIENLTDKIMKLAKDKGFGTNPDDVNTLEKIAFIHSEISEAMEAYRHKNLTGKDGFSEELADAIIRIFHLARVHDIDLEKEIINKLEHNQGRIWEWDKMNETHN